MKKLFGRIIVGIFLAGSFAAATETFGKVELTPDLQFSAEKKDGGVAMHWKKWDDDFMWAKVSRSTINADPVYPEDGAIFWSDDPDETTFFDPDPPHGKIFYRVCVITHARKRFCSGVVAIENAPEKAADFCIQIITPAKNPETGECREFPTPCAVPENFEKVEKCDEKIELSGKFDGEKVLLKWTAPENFAKNGFQILKSTTPNPEFPPREIDAPNLWIAAENREFADKNVKSGEKYFYKICEYLGKEKCGAFSNEIAVEIPKKDVVDAVLKNFSDVDRNSEIGKIIEKFAKNGVVHGFPDGTFRPQKPVTRAELAKMAALAFHQNPAPPTAPIFCDVPIDAWFAPFVHFFAENHFARGFENEKCPLGKIFAPNNPVKKNEAIKMILEISGNSAPENPDDWFLNFFQKAVEKKIIRVPRDDFRERDPATRAEILLFLDRALQK